MRPIRAFTDHPASVGESYGEHLVRAVCFGTRMVFAGLACLIHGVLPFMFERTGSSAVKVLNERMVRSRGVRLDPIASDKRLSL
ncbi:MAG TPA: DUF6356 family protein [Steroidobacteraceae bacterium]|jgi:hypothetical protein